MDNSYYNIFFHNTRSIILVDSTILCTKFYFTEKMTAACKMNLFELSFLFLFKRTKEDMVMYDCLRSTILAVRLSTIVRLRIILLQYKKIRKKYENEYNVIK